MNEGRESDNILDECLQRLLDKDETIEECLARYPQKADELRPLLKVALATKQAAAVQPLPEFRDRARYQFLSALQEVKSKRHHPFFSWQRRWVTVTVAVLVLLLAGSGTVAAATNSMPNGPLYKVKLLTERVQLALTPSDLGKAELAARAADRRVAEIIYMAQEGDPEQVDIVTQRLNNSLVMVTSLVAVSKEESSKLMVPAQAPAPVSETAPAEEDGELTAPRAGTPDDANAFLETDGERAKLRMMLEHDAINNPDALRAILPTAPEATKPALRQAIIVTVASYKKALEAVE